MVRYTRDQEPTEDPATWNLKKLKDFLRDEGLPYAGKSKEECLSAVIGARQRAAAALAARQRAQATVVRTTRCQTVAVF